MTENEKNSLIDTNVEKVTDTKKLLNIVENMIYWRSSLRHMVRR